jgi:hypothetical protein
MCLDPFAPALEINPLNNVPVQTSGSPGNFGLPKSCQDIRGAALISSTMLRAAPAAPSVVTAAISRLVRAFQDRIQQSIGDGHLIGMKRPNNRGGKGYGRPERKHSRYRRETKMRSERVIVRRSATVDRRRNRLLSDIAAQR